MDMNKKAEGLSLTTIIVAAIALVVLIIILLIFSGRMSLFKGNLDSCPTDAPAVPKLESDGMCKSNKLPVKTISEKDSTGKIVTQYCCPSS